MTWTVAPARIREQATFLFINALMLQYQQFGFLLGIANAIIAAGALYGERKGIAVLCKSI